MVKSLADILSEIEKRESVRTFSMGGSPDEAQDSQYGGDTPSDPGQDDTLDESDQGLPTAEDWGGLEAATIDEYGPITDAEKKQAAAAYNKSKMDRIIEETAYEVRNPEYMNLITQNPNITTRGIVTNLLGKPPQAPEERTWIDKGLDLGKTALLLALAPKTLGGSLLGLTAGGLKTSGLGDDKPGWSLGWQPGSLPQDVLEYLDIIDGPVIGTTQLAEIGRQPASAPPTSNTMIAQQLDKPTAPVAGVPSVKDELITAAIGPTTPTDRIDQQQVAQQIAQEIAQQTVSPVTPDTPVENETLVSMITGQQQQQQPTTLSGASVNPSQTGPTNTGIDPEDPHFEDVPTSNISLGEVKAAGSDLYDNFVDLLSIDKDNQTTVAQVNPLAPVPTSSSSSSNNNNNKYGDMGGDGGNDSVEVNPLTTAIVNNIIDTPVVDKETEQVSNWSFDPSMWYPAAQGGAIDAFSVGGLAGMMMPRQQQSKSLYFNDTPGSGSTRYNPYTGGSPNVPPQFGGQLPPQFPGFVGPFGPQKPPIQLPQRPKLDAQTYFHEHEGGKVNYPNFPQPYVSPENKPNPFKPRLDPIVDPVRPSRPFQTYPQISPDEAIRSQMNAVEQQPVPPVSISETTATAMQPDEIQETQTTIEEAPVPREIDIQMPQNITATLDFPEQVRGTANYARGGLTGLAYNYPEQYGIGGWIKSLIPSLAGAAAMMIPGIGQMASPWIVGGLTGAATGALGGGKKDRTLLGAAKNFLMGGSGASAVGTANPALVGKDIAANASTPTFMGNISNTASGFANQFDELGINELLNKYKGPIAGSMAASSIVPPTSFNEVEVEQIKTMTPEQRRAYIESKRKQYSNRTMQPTTFSPPNVDIGFDVTTAADGGVMEIDEEMESGSFVLPADVVSNVGDGSSDAGHRRLAQLFGGGDDYAIGGGTGILKGPIKGPGGGLDDLIQTGIDGVRVARLSTDEFVVPKDVVRRLGDGSQKAGSEKLYDFMKDVRLKKHGTPDQPKEMHMSGLRKMV